MSVSYFDLLKYAATGIASPDMTYYDKLRASALMGGGTVQTLTGQPPLSFKSDGSPLISWSMKGNGSQQGTPTPDNPIQPEFVGDKTANVMPAGEKKTVVSNGVTFDSDGNGRYHVYGTATGEATAKFNLARGFITPISVSNNGQGTLSFFNNQRLSNVTVAFYNGTSKVDDWVMSPLQRTSTAYNTIGNKYVDNIILRVPSGAQVDMLITPEFTNDGVLPTEFEPFGYKIPISCGGQTTPVYLGQVSTVRIIRKLVLTGEENITSGHLDRNLFNIPIDDYLRAPIVGVICTHYIAQQNVDEWSKVSNGNACFYIGTNSEFKQLYIRDSSYSTIADFKSYLAQQYTNGTPVTIWYVLAEPETAIVNEPLAKIGDYADELHSTDAGVSIPTAKGQNTLTVDTTLQPSEMTITFKG